MSENKPLYASPFMIGDVAIPCRTIFAPMAGVSDLPFRLLCHEMGAGLVCMEMISAKAITYRSRRTNELWETSSGEKPVSLQIFGHEPEVMAEACRILEEQDFDILDINMGCPVPKIVNNREGSALMKDPSLIEKVVRACRENSSRPVTVKIRKGFDTTNAVEVALAAQEGGASAVCVHGRTREQYYSGVVDRNVIKDVKDALSIPVIASGDVTDAASGMSMLAETGCDMVMIGRGALGNPWIFRELNAAYRGLDIPPRPSDEERTAMMLRHLDMLCALKGETTGVKEFRKYIIRYTKGMHGAAAVRRRANDVLSLKEMKEVIQIG